jgi:primosomal protein N' (replication factor Y) (superfamily II helicase)
VDVCVSVPRLALDRPFTYLLKEGQEAGVGSLVSVPFHGRTMKGWILGPASDVPGGRLLPVRSIRSAVRFFDPAMLEVLRWVSDRYLAPLSTVIERSHPPRVAGEEGHVDLREHPPASVGEPTTVLGGYGGADLLGTGRATWLRPLPDDEVDVCAAAVEACVAAGRQALVLVPEADPVPATASAVLERMGGRAVSFLGGDAHDRYRTWLEIRSGRYEVVVGTRPAVFAPLERLGLIWISREVHPGHREERSPYYHVREVAAARARLQRAACVLASFSPSVETALAVAAGSVQLARPPRTVERAASPLVETVAPEAEDRSTRLGSLLKKARSGALIVSRRGYGIARVCRACGEQAACAVCHGPIGIEEGRARCRTCGSAGRCANCGGSAFGVEPAGTERIAEWTRRRTSLPVDLDTGKDAPPRPRPGRVVVGTAAAVKDVGPVKLDLVAILDPDRALARAGMTAGEQALATWMEAAAWAGPRSGGGRVLAQSRRPGHPAIQALVRWDPVPFLLAEAKRRAEAGFPAGHPVFRMEGSEDLPPTLQSLGANVVVSAPVDAAAEGRSGHGRTLCLVTVDQAGFDRFGREVRRLAADGVVERIEAEPQL